MSRMPVLSFETKHSVVQLLEVNDHFEVVSKHNDGFKYKVTTGKDRARAITTYFTVLDEEIW